MVSIIKKMSLRARLIWLTAFALAALLIAVLSAYRTTRTSQFFAERQAAASVNSAVRELARDFRDFSGGENKSDFGKDKKPLPPHIREALEKYHDPLTRTTAIALNAPDEVSGGFCTVNGDVKGAIYNQDYAAEETVYIQNVCRSTNENGSRQYDFQNDVLYVSSVKFENNDTDISGAFAVRRVAKMNLFANRFNFVTQLFLLISVVGLVIFSFLTLREWRGGMRKIETGLQAITRDLSSRIDAPKISELAHISREINSLAENLETNLKCRQELEKDLAHSEKLAALGRVASGAAHEIRNPLAAMKLKIQLAQRGDFDKAKLEKTFVVLNEEINRLDRVVTKMLDAGKQEKMNIAELSPVEILRGRIDLIVEKASAQNVKIDANFPAENLRIEADGEKLTQIFDNLLLNALEAMPEGGVLKIESFADAKKIIFEISNTGAGISNADKERIFEPFFTTKDKGTGLGLAISREIVEAHNGRLFLRESANGAKFVLELTRTQRK